MNEFIQSIYINVAHIPKGRVMTYGNLAALSGFPKHARYVGKVLAKLPKESRLPWHRVVNTQGKISLKGEAFIRQKSRLEKEGVEINSDGKIMNFKQVIIR